MTVIMTELISVIKNKIFTVKHGSSFNIRVFLIHYWLLIHYQFLYLIDHFKLIVFRLIAKDAC
jgi:hypothetical protein